MSAAEVTGVGSKTIGNAVWLGQTLVGKREGGDEEEEKIEDAQDTAQAKLFAEQEDQALFERGLSNLEQESVAEAHLSQDDFGDRGGWGAAGQESRHLVGQSVESGVRLASAALHKFVDVTGVKM